MDGLSPNDLSADCNAGKARNFHVQGINTVLGRYHFVTEIPGGKALGSNLCRDSDLANVLGFP
jgi:hypothetical protein